MELFAAEEKSSRLFRKRGGGGKGAMACVRGDGSGKGLSFSGRCARLVKEQRARFYIMRRCVTMLVCWREYS
ncbi:hypothetical protein HU200_004758 [Digitaria exilis]|uniref:ROTUNDIFOLIA like 8 n=1 Tax=Digitaria exilis TaxID=1010633 RepID=A0A835FSV6_9POAL|nr:hypothetical protein HU200_004758 [Digitaria exilis]